MQRISPNNTLIIQLQLCSYAVNLLNTLIHWYDHSHLLFNERMQIFNYDACFLRFKLSLVSIKNKLMGLVSCRRQAFRVDV